MKKNPLIAQEYSNLSAKDLFEYGILDPDTFPQVFEMGRKKKLLEEHKYAFSLLKDGRWQTHYIDAKGKRKELRAKSKEELEEKLYTALKIVREESALTLEKLFPVWLEYKSSITASNNTILRHKQHYKKYLEDAPIMKKNIECIGRTDLNAFCNNLVKTFNLSAKEFTNVKTIIKGMFEYAFDNEMITSNPMDKMRITVKFRQVNKKASSSQVFNKDELKNLIQYLEKQFAATGNIALLGIELNFFLGLRIGELVALKYSDIQDGSIHVQREEVRDQSTNKTYVAEHTKTHCDRFVPIVPAANVILERIREASQPASDDCYIFSRDGVRMQERVFAYILEKYAERNGLPVKSTHKMRKTYASMLNANGIPIDEIRQLLGHSNLETTYRYLYNYLTPEETISRMADALAV